MPADYNVFISWSGARSRMVAAALQEWLPTVLQCSKPWMSATDIEKGTIGVLEIGKALDGIRHGIVCLTPENLDAPWVLFEAGAIAHKVADKKRLYTYLLGGLEGAHLKPPLSNYQYTLATKDDTLKMLLSLNGVLSAEPVAERHLKDVFEAFWPTLQRTLQDLPPVSAKLPAKRPPEEMFSEILELLRAQKRQSEGSPLGAALMGESEALRQYIDNWPGPRGTYFATAPIGSPGVPCPSGHMRLGDILATKEVGKGPGAEDNP